MKSILAICLCLVFFLGCDKKNKVEFAIGEKVQYSNLEVEILNTALHKYLVRLPNGQKVTVDKADLKKIVQTEQLSKN